MTVAPAQALPGPQKALRKLGLFRPIDLPLRYEDETRLVKLCEVHAGEVAQIESTVTACEVKLVGLFGLVPHWSRGTAITRHTYNACSETVASKPSFREAWKRAQHCIIQAEAFSFFESDWRSGRPIPTRIARENGAPMGMAGLWSAWRSPQGDVVHSYPAWIQPVDATH